MGNGWTVDMIAHILSIALKNRDFAYLQTGWTVVKPIQILKLKIQI